MFCPIQIGRTWPKAGRTNSRTNCQQNRIAISQPVQPGLICPSVRLSVCTYLQIRCSAENGTGQTDSVNYSSKSWIYNVNCESEILRKKYICKSNTVNNMKLMILEKTG
jgi:hypothetical protein